MNENIIGGGTIGEMQIGDEPEPADKSKKVLRMPFKMPERLGAPDDGEKDEEG